MTWLCLYLKQVHSYSFNTTMYRLEEKLCIRGGSISPSLISIRYWYLQPKILVVSISISFTAALCGLLTFSIIARKVVNGVSVIPYFRFGLVKMQWGSTLPNEIFNSTHIIFVFKLMLKSQKSTIKCREMANILFVTNTTSIYWKTDI